MLSINFWVKALFVLVLPLSAYAAEKTGPKIGQVSPNIVGRTLDERWYRLEKDLGTPKVINFFWVGCVPCRKEMPELAVLEKHYPKVKFMAVHTERETPENVINFIKSINGAPSNIVLTLGGMQEYFQYLGLPHTILLDKNNVVLMNLSGYTAENMQKLNTALKQLEK